MGTGLPTDPLPGLRTTEEPQQGGKGEPGGGMQPVGRLIENVPYRFDENQVLFHIFF